MLVLAILKSDQQEKEAQRPHFEFPKWHANRGFLAPPYQKWVTRLFDLKFGWGGRTQLASAKAEDGFREEQSLESAAILPRHLSLLGIIFSSRLWRWPFVLLLFESMFHSTQLKSHDVNRPWSGITHVGFNGQKNPGRSPGIVIGCDMNIWEGATSILFFFLLGRNI